MKFKGTRSKKCRRWPEGKTGILLSLFLSRPLKSRYEPELEKKKKDSFDWRESYRIGNWRSDLSACSHLYVGELKGADAHA